MEEVTQQEQTNDEPFKGRRKFATGFRFHFDLNRPKFEGKHLIEKKMNEINVIAIINSATSAFDQSKNVHFEFIESMTKAMMSHKMHPRI